MEQVTMKYAFPCRKGCGQPAREGKACCSQQCRDKMQNCEEEGCQNATEPITYQGQDYAGYTAKCYEHGGRSSYEGQVHEGRARKILFVHTIKGWLQVISPIHKMKTISEYDYNNVKIVITENN